MLDRELRQALQCFLDPSRDITLRGRMNGDATLRARQAVSDTIRVATVTIYSFNHSKIS